MPTDRDLLRRHEREIRRGDLANLWTRYRIHRDMWEPSETKAQVRPIPELPLLGGEPRPRVWTTVSCHAFCGRLLPCSRVECALCETVRQLEGDEAEREADDLRRQERTVVPLIVRPHNRSGIWFATPSECRELRSIGRTLDVFGSTTGHDLFVWQEGDALQIRAAAKRSCLASKDEISTLRSAQHTFDRLERPNSDVLAVKIRETYGAGEDDDEDDY